MKVEKTGTATYYYVEDEKENVYYVTCYYDENGDWDNWDVYRDGEDVEIKDNELRKRIINSITESE